MRSLIDQSSEAIDFLRFPLAVLVVVFHTSAVDGLCVSMSASSSLRVIFCVVGNIAVPLFFIISGYFFFTQLDRWEWKRYGKNLQKRLRTLLLPYFLWGLLALVVMSLYDVLQGTPFNATRLYVLFHDSEGWRLFYDKGPGAVEMGRNIFGADVPLGKPIDQPLWFIRDLFCMCLVSPLLYWQMTRLKKVALLLLFLLYYFNIAIPVSGFAAVSVFFFSLGGYFMINQKDIVSEFWKYRKLAYIFAAVLLLAAVLSYGRPYFQYVLRLFVPFGVIACIDISYALISKKKVRVNKFLTDSTFFVYAIHAICILDVANFLLWKALPFENEFVFTLKVFLRPAVATGICLGLFWLMKKLTPRTLAILTGGRADR